MEVLCLYIAAKIGCRGTFSKQAFPAKSSFYSNVMCISKDKANMLQVLL